MPAIDRALWAAQLPPRFLVPSLSPSSRLPNPSSPSTPCLLPTRPSQVLQCTQRRTIKSTFAPRPNRFNQAPDLPVLTTTKTAAIERKLVADTLPLRTGALATKKGMMSLYDTATGHRIPCTVLQLDRNQVISYKRRDKHGYWAVQVGAGAKDADNVSRPMLGHFAASEVAPKRWVAEFRVRDEDGLRKTPIGSMLSAAWFAEGQFVDARSNSRGMGFAGGMKKHNWSGQPASHGNSLTHRAMGSAGGSQGSGSRVIPGKKMAGRMGNERNTIQNLKVLKVDAVNGLVVVGGPVAGPKGCVVRIQDALKKKWPDVPEGGVVLMEGKGEQIGEAVRA